MDGNSKPNAGPAASERVVGREGDCYFYIPLVTGKLESPETRTAMKLGKTDLGSWRHLASVVNAIERLVSDRLSIDPYLFAHSIHIYVDWKKALSDECVSFDVRDFLTTVVETLCTTAEDLKKNSRQENPVPDGLAARSTECIPLLRTLSRASYASRLEVSVINKDNQILLPVVPLECFTRVSKETQEQTLDMAEIEFLGRERDKETCWLGLGTRLMFQVHESWDWDKIKNVLAETTFVSGRIYWCPVSRCWKLHKDAMLIRRSEIDLFGK